jgi:Asp-tRNA(Asn)/Glu-tRNA(Gln) amidotransferase A subunit family amidase
VPKHDAEIVRRLGVAGAVLVAKLSLGELAMGDTWFGGRTRNPWSPAQGSGGSSAGPAAATAAGLVGFSIGSETLGSIGNPCMICGTTGLRPTFGRVARSGAMALCWSLDKLGPICRSVEDAALVLAATQGAHAGDPDSRDAALHFDVRRSARGRRIGFVPEQFDAEETTDVERAALDTLRADGAELCELELPDLPYEGVFVLVWVEAAAAFQSLLTRGQLGELRGQDGSSWPNLFRAAHLVSAVEYVQLLRVRTRVMRETAALFANVDAIVAPDMGSRFHLVTNVTGHPSLTLRAGFRPDGTPASVTLHGQLFGDGALLEIGRALESRLGVWERRPPGTSP